MTIVEKGAGAPVVLVPGIQGRWEWMRPTIDALAARHRVLTFSLGHARSFDEWDQQIDDALDRAGVAGTLVGVSFGGLVALRYAARHPDRVSALVLASTPPPGWTIDRWSARCVAHPWLGLPLFSARGVVRLAPEILMARPSWRDRLGLAAAYATRVLSAPVSPRDMAAYVRAWRTTTFPPAGTVHTPTLVVTGERGCDRVVPVDQTMQYLTLIPGAQHAELAGTGHVGVITKPHLFAEVVERFLASRPPRTDVSLDTRARHAS